MSDSLRDARQRIDSLDDELLALLNRRAALALEVAELKSGSGGAATYYRPEREAQLLRRLLAANAGPLGAHQVVQLFREIVSACRSLEQVLTIGYLQATALEPLGRYFGRFVKPVACADESALLDAVASRDLDLGFIPEPRQGQILSARWREPQLHICGTAVHL
ncbi:MAG: chorismate mutase, partial [Pseudomonadota bacterium]|nr:chorismate mutase [Pseudomonadota bacterium]